MEDDISNFQFREPFTCLVAGPTSSGKTQLIRRILKNHNVLFTSTGPLKVIWCYGQWQDLYTQPIADDVTVTYIEGLPGEETISSENPRLIVLDDLMEELGKEPKVANLFTRGSHHLGISVMFVVQNIFHKTPVMRTISLNSHYIILMKNPRDKSQVQHLARQLYPTKPNLFVEAYNDATSTNYGYIKVDLTQKTPEKFRFQTRITKEEIPHLGVDFAPIVYVPK